MRISDWSSDVCSSDLFFTTSASGVVNITDPAIDNDPDIVTANYLIMWDVTGTTQQDYKVVVTRTDTGATLVDTDWVTSTAEQYLVEGKVGRGSCRERVCQYVEISVGAGF